MLSTVDDMHAFYRALFDTEKLLPRDARASRFDPDEPVGLAGSDGVNFFLYDREPRSRTEIIIASTNAAFKAPMIRRALGGLLGLPNQGANGGEEMARRPGGKAAPAPVAAVLTGLVNAINAGDSVAMRRFIVEHFAEDEGAPSIDERVRRIGGLHERLGVLTVKKIETFEQGPAEITLESVVQGSAVLKVNVDRAAPYSIHGLQILVEGPN
jgi:hypothetical protein